MKKLLFALLLFQFIVGCDTDKTAESPWYVVSAKSKADKVKVCHKGKIITINGNAMDAHQAHGDAVDMDGDGFFDNDNTCSATDCDDNDAADCALGTAALLVGTWTTMEFIIETSIGTQTVIDYLVDVVGLSPTEAATQYAIIESMLEYQVVEFITFNADNTYESTFLGGSDSGTWILSTDETTLTLFEGPDIIAITINAISETTLNATLGDDILMDIDGEIGTPDVAVTVVADLILNK